MDFLYDAVDYLTDPNGTGFPMLIAGGLGLILYLMHFTTKEQKKSDQSLESKKDKYRDTDIPFKPF